MPDPIQRMQCMEIWGGNAVAENRVTTAGLDVHISSRPAEGAEGGGDLHFVSSCASGRITRFVLADVSGHGEAIASVAVAVRDLMRRHLNHVDQTRFVETLNRRFAEAGGGDLFATAVVGTYFATTRRLAVCLAGHPPPLIRRAGRWLHATVPSADDRIANIPLGVLPKIPYRETVVDLRPGDTVIAYTDAANEARRPDGTMLGMDGVRSMLDDGAREPFEVVETLSRDLDAWREGPGDDDQSLLLIHANASASRWIDSVLAPLRLARVLRRPADRRGGIVTPA